MDLRPLLPRIAAPTLVVMGADDPATPPAMGEAIRALIPGAELAVLPHAAHILAMEQAGRVNQLLLSFLEGPPFEAGLRNRRAVLGAEHVDRSLANAGAFAAPWQDFITRMAWGEVWGDPALPWKTRSLVTLALMVSLGREEEFKLHVRPALRNGVTLTELRSLLKQCAVYAGVPAGNAAHRWVREVLGAEADEG
jgi:3-oxoadipate enol-lactonase / 4-carboxymuconolactone decarboxylase